MAIIAGIIVGVILYYISGKLNKMINDSYREFREVEGEINKNE